MSKFLSVIVLWIFTLSLANALDDYTKDQVDNFVLSQIATGNNCAMIQSYFQTSLDGYIKSVNHALDCKGIYLNYIVSYAKTGSVSGSGSTVDCLVPMPNPDAFIGTMMNVVDMEDQEVVRLKDMYNAMSEQKREASSFCQKKVQVSTEKWNDIWTGSINENKNKNDEVVNKPVTPSKTKKVLHTKHTKSKSKSRIPNKKAKK